MAPDLVQYDASGAPQAVPYHLVNAMLLNEVWMAPCLIRDHHAEFMKIMGEHEVRPLDDDAKAALDDPAYHAGLEQFDRDYEALTGPQWQERYREGTGIPPAPMKRR